MRNNNNGFGILFDLVILLAIVVVFVILIKALAGNL